MIIFLLVGIGLIGILLLFFFSFSHGKKRLNKFHEKCRSLGFQPLSGILRQHCAGNWQGAKSFIAFYPQRNFENKRGIAIFMEIGQTISATNELPSNAKIIPFNNLLKGSFLDLVIKEGFSGKWKGSALMLLLSLNAEISEINNNLEFAYSLCEKLRSPNETIHFKSQNE